MATVTTGPMTAEEFADWAARPENQGRRVELDRGEVVEMPPPSELHGLLCSWIAHLLWRFVIARGKGAVFSNDTGLIVERRPDTVRGPDLMLFDETRSLENVSRKFSERLPSLVVEVQSPSDQRGKVDRRIKQYLRRGVSLVWLVDPEVRTVTVFQPGKEFCILDETEELTGEDALPDLRFRVAELFALPGA
jgi:Uma2 family endonuclease